jgi:hypothetical protein
MEDAMSELGPEAKGLLEAARGGDEPSADDRVRVRAGIAARVAVGAAAGATLTAATTAAGAGAAATAGAVAAPLGLGMKLLFVVGAVAAVGVGTVTYIDSQPRHAPLDARAPSVPASIASSAYVKPTSAAPAPSEPAVAPAPSASASADPVKPEPPAPRATAPASAPDPAPAASVERELALVREAHAALQAGDAARALVLLDEHARRYPSGALSEEREAARVLVLCALGRTGEARVAAERFLRVFPRSPQAARVRASCGGAF